MMVGSHKHNGFSFLFFSPSLWYYYPFLLGENSTNVIKTTSQGATECKKGRPDKYFSQLCSDINNCFDIV